MKYYVVDIIDQYVKPRTVDPNKDEERARYSFRETEAPQFSIPNIGKDEADHLKRLRYEVELQIAKLQHRDVIFCEVDNIGDVRAWFRRPISKTLDPNA
jgi:hypothetical protein